jgi:hypothetical protein
LPAADNSWQVRFAVRSAASVAILVISGSFGPVDSLVTRDATSRFERVVVFRFGKRDPSSRGTASRDPHPVIRIEFGGYVEGLCQRCHANEGRPGLPPARFRRLLLIGYFEGLDGQLRKIIKTRGHSPTDEAATKLLWLALRNVTRRWTMPVRL